MADDTTPSAEVSTGVRIMHARIRNFRCLREIDVALSQEILLIGENSTGKTSFLDALHLAIGAGQRAVGEEDIFLLPTEQAPPKDRMITIDLLLRPVGGDGAVIEAFPAGSPWLELWGSGIGQDDQEDDFVGLRTQVKWNSVRGEYITERRFLGQWIEDPDRWEEAKPMEKLGLIRAAQLEPIELHYVDARRDIAADLTGRGSLWQRMVSDPGLSEESVAQIEESLNAVNERIIEESPVLTHIQGHLDGLHEALASEEGSVRVTPLSRNLRDLRRGMDIVLSSGAGPVMPVARQGMGTRSMSSLLTFRAFVEWRTRLNAGEAYHPTVAIEEPEAHLQPQAQRSLTRVIQQIPAQRIVSTHSPYVCSQTTIENFRHFAKGEAGARVTSLLDDGAPLSPEDVRRINREVVNTRGELLFARGLLLFEGETEEQALPDFAEAYWGRHIHELGLSFIGVGGSGKYLPFLRMATRFDIPWYVLSDGKPQDVAAVNAALEQEGLEGAEENERVFVIPGETDFEGYLAQDDYRATLERMIVDSKAQSPEHREALEREYGGKSLDEIAEELRQHKTRYGALVGARFGQEGLDAPPLFRDVFDLMTEQLRLRRKEDQ